jgi:hypothetical protein
MSASGPHCMRKIGTQTIGSHLTNLLNKRWRITVNFKTGSRKRAISKLHIPKISDKKAANDEGCLFTKCLVSVVIWLLLNL